MIWAKYVLGLAAVACGVRWIVRRKVEIGIEGREHSLVVTGIKAVFLGIAAVLTGGFVLLFV